MGALFLKCLDERMEKSGLFYVRFMDDILVLSPTRWKLKKAVKEVNQVLGSLNLEKHPDKTFIGRIERGFDFLGYHFGPDGLSVAAKTIENFIARAIRLYEQEPGEADASTRLGSYVRRWVRWTRAGFYPRGRTIGGRAQPAGPRLRVETRSTHNEPSSYFEPDIGSQPPTPVPGMPQQKWVVPGTIHTTETPSSSHNTSPSHSPKGPPIGKTKVWSKNPSSKSHAARKLTNAATCAGKSILASGMHSAPM